MKTDPFIELSQPFLYPGEVMIPLNPYALEGCVIKPYYYVTSLGRIFSVANGVFEEKRVQKDQDGYMYTGVETYQYSTNIHIHRAVMSSFYPRPDMYNLQVDHKKGEKYDNRLYMLRWTTPKRNVQLAAEDGRGGPKSRHINDNAIIFIMQKVKDGLTKEEISELCDKELNLKIQPQTINDIRTGHGIYKNILANLNIEPILKKEYKRLTDKDHDKILNLYKNEISIDDISQELNIDRSTVLRTLSKYFGSNKERKDKDKSSLEKQKPTEKINKINPFVTIPQKYIDQNIELFPINIYACKGFIIRQIYFITKDGRIFSMGRGNQLKELLQSCNEKTKGYCMIGMVTDKGDKSIRVHRLVLATFNPRPDMYDLEVDHSNRKKNDNRLENLEWVDHKLNMKRAGEQGAIKTKSPQQIVSDEDVIIINKLAWSGKTDKEIAEYLDSKYFPSMVKKVRIGRVPYDKILKALHLEPYRKKKCFFKPEEKEEIYKYIESRIANYPRHPNTENTSSSVVALYKEAGEKFGGYWETMRDIYKEIKNK